MESDQRTMKDIEIAKYSRGVHFNTKRQGPKQPEKPVGSLPLRGGEPGA